MAIFDLDEYFGSLKNKYNIADEDLAGVDEVRKGFLRQDEFTRRGQKLDKEHRDRMAVEDKFHTDLMTAKQKLDLVGQLEQRYGPAEQWSDALAASIGQQFPALAQPSANVTLEQVQQIVDQATTGLRQQIAGTAQGAAIMIDFSRKIPAQWEKKYGTEFPDKEFTEFFQKSGTNDPFIAYQMFERPKSEEFVANKHKEDLAAAEQRGYQSAMSKYGHVETPVSSSPGNVWEMLDKQAGKPAPAPAAKPDKGGSPEPTPAPAPEENPVSYEERKVRVGSAYQKALDAANSGKVPGATPGM